jgi:hypothetical protein
MFPPSRNLYILLFRLNADVRAFVYTFHPHHPHSGALSLADLANRHLPPGPTQDICRKEVEVEVTHQRWSGSQVCAAGM